MSAKQQTKKLANYILQETPHLPEPHEGAGDTAVRLLKEYRDAMKRIMETLSVPPDYPAFVGQAYQIAGDALGIQD